MTRLRADNAVLKQRLQAAEALAREREERIEDLLAALQMLPEAWTRRLEQVARRRWGAEAPPIGSGEVSEAIWEESPRPIEAIEVSAASAPSEEPTAEAPPREEALDAQEMARALGHWREIRRLRDRLELEHLERERERLRALPARSRSAVPS